MAKLGLAQRITEETRSRRSPLYVWLRENQGEISQSLSVSRPSWNAIAAIAVKAGLLDAKGNQPTPNAVRSAWLRVLKDRPAPVLPVAAVPATLSKQALPNPLIKSAPQLQQPKEDENEDFEPNIIFPIARIRR